MNRILKFCTIDRVEALLKESTFASYSADDVRTAYQEATDLADGAYERLIEKSTGDAERILHLIHFANAYTQPLHPVLNAIHNKLMQAKLSKFMSQSDQVGPVSEDEMSARLSSALEETRKADFSLLELVTTSGSKPMLAHYTKNWFNAIGGFDHHLLSLFLHTKHHTLQKAIVENLEDEFVTDVSHYEVRLQWCRSVGVDFRMIDRVRDPDILTESFAVQSFRTGISHLPDPTYCVGLFYAIEAHHAFVCNVFTTNLKKLGYDKKSLEYWVGHGELDEDHAAEWLASIKASKLSPAQLGNVVSGALMMLENRRRLFIALERDMRTRIWKKAV